MMRPVPVGLCAKTLGESVVWSRCSNVPIIGLLFENCKVLLSRPASRNNVRTKGKILTGRRSFKARSN